MPLLSSIINYPLLVAGFLFLQSDLSFPSKEAQDSRGRTVETHPSVDNHPQSMQRSILVFSATRGFRHASIPAGIQALKEIAAENSWNFTHTEDSSLFTSENLKKFDAIILLNTTGNVFGAREEAALQDFVHSGGGVAGIHAAADCEYEWPWYNQLIGGYFESHPAVQSASILVKANHPSTAHLGASWIHKDEWYNYKSLSKDIKVLLELDEHSYKGGKMPAFHPIAWHQDFEGGKVFYTGLGHTPEAFSDNNFRQHLEEGIRSILKKRS